MNYVDDVTGSQHRSELRCAVASRMSGEPLIGTAPPVRSWLLLERPGAWSQAALAETLAAVFTPAQRRVLGVRTREQGLRTLLVRRAGRDAAVGASVFVGSAVPGAEFLERIEFSELGQAADLDLDRSWDGGVGERVDGPLFLVCTHGSKDMCCAVDGRPLARILSNEHGERVWECSHVGGDRFAGNLVVAPYGEFYGRLDAQAALSVAAGALAGEVTGSGLRGRAAYDHWAQAAEAVVRQAYAVAQRGQLRIVSSRHGDTGAEVEVELPDAVVTVTLERRPGAHVAASRCRGGIEAVELAVVGLRHTARVRP